MSLARTAAVVFTLSLIGTVFLAMRPAVGQQPPVNVPDGQVLNLYRANPQLMNLSGIQVDAASKLFAEESGLENQARSLVEQYGRTEKEAERSKIKSKLADVLSKQFDIQQKRRKEEVAQIEAQLRKVQDLMRRRAEAKDTIVDKRLDQLLREAEGLGWTAPSNPHLSSYIPPSGLLQRR